MEKFIQKYKATFTAISAIHIGGNGDIPASRYLLSQDGKEGYCLKSNFVARKLKEGKLSIREFMEKPALKEWWKDVSEEDIFAK